MLSFTNDNVKQYYNLSQYNFRGDSTSVLDRTALSFANYSSPTAWVTYRVSGAEEVRAGVYNNPGISAALNAKDGKYYLGIFQENMASIAAKQAFYSAASNAVYLDESASSQMYSDGTSYFFDTVASPPKGGIIGYGINFYYSLDGNNFVRIPHPKRVVARQSGQYGFLYYEEYTASIPTGAKYIRVEINDVTGIVCKPYWGGADYVIAKAQQNMTSLAAVTITGNSLVAGEPIQIPAQTQSQNNQATDAGAVYNIPESTSEKESSKVQNYPQSEEPGKSEVLAAQSSPQIEQENKSASSKFEGTITSSQGSSRSQAPTSSPDRYSAASEKTDTPESVQESDMPREESIVYEIRREEGGKRLSGAVSAYIAVVTAALFFVILMPKKK